MGATGDEQRAQPDEPETHRVTLPPLTTLGARYWDVLSR